MNQLNRHARAGHRDGLRDGEPAGELRLLERREGDRGVRRRRVRARAGAGRAPVQGALPGRPPGHAGEAGRSDRAAGHRPSTARPRVEARRRSASLCRSARTPEAARVPTSGRVTQRGLRLSATTAARYGGSSTSPGRRVADVAHDVADEPTRGLERVRDLGDLRRRAARARLRSAPSRSRRRRGGLAVADAVRRRGARLARRHGGGEHRRVRRRRSRARTSLRPLLEQEAPRCSPRAGPRGSATAWRASSPGGLTARRSPTSSRSTSTTASPRVRAGRGRLARRRPRLRARRGTSTSAPSTSGRCSCGRASRTQFVPPGQAAWLAARIPGVRGAAHRRRRRI